MTLTTNSDLKINNTALKRIKSADISSLTNPTTDKEAICAELYPLAIRALMCKHEWNFCEVERSLSVDNDKTPAKSYDYAYRLPSALLAGPFEVTDSAGYPIDYYNSEDYIHTDSLTCKIICRVMVPIENCPWWFVDLAVHDLAMQYAAAIKQDGELASELRIITYGPAALDGEGGKYGDAKTLDAKTQRAKTIFANGDPLTATRR